MTKALLLTAASAAAFAFASPAVARPMTATDMHMMHRLGTPEVSPDGKWAVFTISDTDLAANKRNNTLYLLDLSKSGASPQRVTGAEKGHDAVFGADGALYFLKAVGERDQLHRMPMGGQAVAISDFGADVSGFKISPAGDRVIVWADQKDCPDLACAATTFPAKPEGSGRTYDKMFVRHWDTWVEPGTRSRIYAFPIEGGKLTGMGVRLTGELEGDTPSKPFGGGEEIAFSPDGKTVYFALREAGRTEPLSTNLDIFASPADGSAPPTNLTDANDAVDNLPVVSPDGRTLAYVAMARPGYESDRQVIQLRDLASGQTRALTQSWDRSVGSIAWFRDGKSLLVTAEDTQETPVFRVDVATGKVTRLTKEGTSGNVRTLPDGGAVFTRQRRSAPNELYLARNWAQAIPLTDAATSIMGSRAPDRDSPIQLRRRQRRHGVGPDHQARRQERPDAGDPLCARRTAGQLRQFVVQPVESARGRKPGLRGGVGRFPRLDRLRAGIHRQHHQRLGRQAARGPAEGVRRRCRTRSRRSTLTTPARWAPATAAT